MSRENVEITRRFFGAWNAGDMEAIREAYDRDVVARTTENWPERGPYFGREAVMNWLTHIRDTWDADALEPISFTDAGDRVVVRQVLRGEGLGPASQIEFTTVTTMRKGKTILAEFFWDHAEALEAVDLAEQAGSCTNVEIVRGIYDAVARRDDAAPFEVYSEDIVWDLSKARRATLFGKAVYHGHAGVRESWRETLAAFGEVDFVVEELTDLGDHVVAVIRDRQIGRASGAAVESVHVAVWTLTDGKVVRMQVFDDRQQALEAVGLLD